MLSSRLAFAAALTLAAGSATAASYTLTDLGYLPGGDDYTKAEGINDSGQVVGYSGGYSAFSDRRAFLWDSGTMTDLGVLPGGGSGSGDSAAFGINNSGQVVGYSDSSTGSRAFLWDSGTGMTDLGVLPDGSSYSGAYGINDSGQVVGYSGRRAFLWDSGTMTDLGVLPGYSRSTAEGINDSGQVVGYISSGTSERGRLAFLWDSGTMTNLGDLPGGINDSRAQAINDSGQIVGIGYSGIDGTRASLWENGSMTDIGYLPEIDFLPARGAEESWGEDINDSGQVVGSSRVAFGLRAFVWDSTSGMQNLNDLIDPTIGWILEDATAINASGQIVGYGLKGTATRAFLLTPVPTTTPVPLPAGFPLLVAALAGLGWLRRRRKTA